MPEEKKARPVHVVRYGRIKAAVWKNETKNGAMYTVTIRRVYKDGDEWRESESFGKEDLLLVEKAAAKAFEYLSSEREPGDV